MFKPIFYNDQFNLNNFSIFILFILRKTYKFVIGIFFIYLIYFLIKPVSYSSSISFYANYNESKFSSSLSLITDFVGIGNQESSGYLGFSISDFINSDKFLFDIVSKNYIINNEELTLIEYWGRGSNDFSLNPVVMLSRINKKLHFSDKISDREKMIYYAKKNLLANIEYSEEQKTGLHSISVKAKDSPQLSSDIAQNIYFSILNYYTSITNTKASEKKEFINDRVSIIEKDLAQFEEKLLEFVVQNKDLLSSPKLVLEKERIERDINMHSQLYITLVDQLEMAKIEEKNNTSSIYLLDNANISEFKSGRNFFFSVIQIILTYFFIVTFFHLIKFRRDILK